MPPPELFTRSVAPRPNAQYQDSSQGPEVTASESLGEPSVTISPEREAQLPVPLSRWAPLIAKAKKIALTLVKIVIVLALVLAWPIKDRVRIVKAVPELSGIYSYFHLYISHSGKGLVFDQVKSELKYDGGIMRLYVDGNVHNATDEIQFVPDIVARALGPDRRIHQSWWVPSPTPTIAAEGNVPFHTEINVPMNHTIEDVYLEFYSKDEEGAVAE